MIPEHVVREVADRMRDCLRDELVDRTGLIDSDISGASVDVSDEAVELLARRAVEVMTTYAQVTWPDEPDA